MTDSKLNGAALNLAKTVIVTGGAGFIGRNLIHRVLREDLTAKIVSIDSGATGDVATLEAYVSLGGVISTQDTGIRFVNVTGDVRNPETWLGVLKVIEQLRFPPVREVYHLACPASPTAHNQLPIDTLLTAVMGTFQCLMFVDRLLRHAQPQFGIPRVFHASTSEVYGDYQGVNGIPGDHQAIREDWRGFVSFTGPRACYDEGKRAAETLIADVMRGSDLDVRVGRLFNVYGPGMRLDDGRVVSSFAKAALAGGPLMICGDGEATRSLTYIDDALDLIQGLMARSENPGPLNLGHDGGTVRIKDLAVRVIEAVGDELGGEPLTRAIVYGEAREDEPRFRVPDMRKLRDALPGWKEGITLEEGLRRTVRYMRGEWEKTDVSTARVLVSPGELP